MKKEILLDLLRAADETIAVIKKNTAPLFSLLQRMALQEASSRLVAGFADADDRLKKPIEDLNKRIVELQLQNLSIDRLKDQAQNVLDQALKALKEPPKELIHDASDRISDLAKAGAFKDPLEDPSVALEDLAFIQDELEQAKVYVVGRIANISDAQVEALLDQAPTLAAIDDDVLEALAQPPKPGQKAVLSEAQASDFGLASGLYQLLDEDEGLTETVKADLVARVGKRTATLRDLAAFDAKAWKEVLQRVKKLTLPDGTDRDAYAKALARRFAILFPSEAFVRRLPPLDLKQIVGNIQQLSPILPKRAEDPPVIEVPYDELPIAGLGEGQLAQIRSAHAALSQLSRTYPGLELNRVIEDFNLTPEAKTDIISRRVGFIVTIFGKHPDKELLFLDYYPDSTDSDSPDVVSLDLAGLGATVDERRMVVSTLKSYQRTQTLADHVDDAHSLLTTGVSSASVAGTKSLEDFKRATGLDDATAKKHHAKARTTLGRTTAMAASVLDLVHGGFDKVRVANVQADPKEMLRKFDGFSDLFGSQDYCKCDSCRSILGPAAYFVDLMTFVHENVRQFFKNKATHRLNLKTRRLDLWNFPLTCANTTTLIPTLDIINEVLENYIAAYVAAKAGNKVDLHHRGSVEALVYSQTLAQKVGSFRQPFVLPEERLVAYLRHFKRDRGDVARAIGASPDEVTRAELGLTVIERHVILSPDLEIDSLRAIYDVNFQDGSGEGRVAPVEVEDLLRTMNVSRIQLGKIVASRFVAVGAGTPEIKSEKQRSSSIQNDVEKVHGLTYNGLDRMHRFTRLWRRSGWSIGELDLVLTELGETSLEAATLRRLASIRRACERLGFTVEHTCPLFARIPEFPANPEDTSFVDRLFNAAPNLEAEGRLPNPNHRFLHPSLRVDNSLTKADPVLPRLLAGLHLSDDDLLRLVTTHLATALGVDPDNEKEDARSFPLNAVNLALLYRHARLARWLGLSIPQLFQALEMVPTGEKRSLKAVKNLDDLDDLDDLLDFHAWFKKTTYTLDDLGVLLGKTVLNRDAYPRVADVVADLIAAPGASNPLVLADTMFTAALGVTEDISKQIFQAILANLEEVPGETPGDTPSGQFRLIDTFDPSATLTIPSELKIDEARVRAELSKHHAVTVVPARLSTALQIRAHKIAELILITGKSLVGPAMAAALRTIAPDDPELPLPPEAQPLVELVTVLLPLTVLFKHPVFDASTVRFVRNHPSPFGLDYLPTIDITGLRSLAVYARLAPVASDVEFTDDVPAVSVADLRKALEKFDPVAASFPHGVNDELARVLRTTGRTMVSLRRHVTLPSPAVMALDQLAQAAAMANHLGVGGQALAEAAATSTADGDLHERAAAELDQLDRAADALRAAFEVAHADNAERDAKLEPIENRLRGRKRDALTDYLIHSYKPAFKNCREISDYFLIDVELEGCARTSRVVSATNSVQLYFQRCLLDLEQDQLKQDDKDHVHVTIDSDTADEWGWRKAYRAWEANRKIFLYPENYLEPDLRDDKTPLFEELESALLQKQIDHQSTLDAYTVFMDGFQEIGNLKIAGAYYHETNDTLHLLGVTASDPPTYYYRAIESPFGRKQSDAPRYHSWRKVTVPITVRHASPVIYQSRLYVFWVEIRSQSVNEILGGKSMFTGYRHKLTLKFTSLRLDGKWTPPQEIILSKKINDCDRIAGVVTDYFDDDLLRVWDEIADLIGLENAVKQKKKIQGRLKDISWTKNPIEDYTLTGANWDTVFPEPTDDGLVLVLRNFRLVTPVSLFRRVTTGSDRSYDTTLLHRFRAPKPKKFLLYTKDRDSLYYGSPPYWYGTPNSFANLVLEEDRIDTAEKEYKDNTKLKGYFERDSHKLANLAGVNNLLAIGGSVEDAILQAGVDAILVKRQPSKSHRYRLERLGTTLANRLARKLFSGGVSALLDLDTQKALKEAAPPLTNLAHIQDSTNAGELDFTGPYGVYYRELFFHIPCLIANHLNSQGNYAGARQWYHHVFNPTASGKGEDRAWRYLELRNQTWPAMRKVLTQESAIRAYEDDPFNPHAIARLRLSAYAKSVVMKYVDNLIDWGDRLFAKFTMESVNEATLLYTMASEILGERPYEAADCGEAGRGMTYAQILQHLGKGSAFLVEVETHAAGKSPAVTRRKAAVVSKYAVDSHALNEARVAVPLAAAAKKAPPKPEPGDAPDDDDDPPPRVQRGGPAWKNTGSSGWRSSAQAHGSGSGASSKDDDTPDRATVSTHAFGWSVVRQMGPAFCVPPNEALLKHWDRVEDRLYKIHNCLDIHGRRRDLALFASEINPRMLVKMKAAGLSLDDVANASSGDLPPYRFAYLIEKAKAFASTLQSFGSALLSALEKKDGEQLARLRLVHEQNLAKMNTEAKQWEIDAAQQAVEVATKQKEAAEFRRDHYDGLLDQGMSAWEETEQLGRHTATIIHSGTPPLRIMQAMLKLMPQVGSPFSMKFGGLELGASTEGFAYTQDTIAAIAESIASSAALEAGFDRRREDWTFQRDLADRDVQQLDRQLKASEIRRDIATRSLEVHEKGIEQTEEVYKFYADKFTNHGLYTWMSAALQRTYGHAFANVLSVARLCQAAFAYERDHEPGITLGANAWNASHAGLLAGEHLLLELQTMERRFIETNYRMLEVEQSFPLTQIDPAALLRQRETGECQFDIPEIFFDLSYPGHYRRRIKAVRLTIPCVTGPYTNVGATLTLMNSQVRTKPHQGLKPVPLQRTISIATSKAQNDAGVFELSFHDERYMPFEGAGAVSAWKLTLPKNFRPFDYETISDVVLTINYTALCDDKLRETVQKLNTTAEEAIVSALKAKPLARVFSLRQEFPVAYRALVNSAPETAVSFEIKDWHFPAFVSAGGRTIQVTTAKLALTMGEGVGTGGVRLVVDGEAVEGFARDDALGGLPAKVIKGQFAKAVNGAHTVAVGAAGELGPEGLQVGNGAALDQGKVADVLLYVEYKVVMP